MPLNFAPFHKKSYFGEEDESSPSSEVYDAVISNADPSSETTEDPSSQTNEEKSKIQESVCPPKDEELNIDAIKPSDLLNAQQNALTMLGIGACKQWDDKDNTYAMSDKQHGEVVTHQKTKERHGGAHIGPIGASGGSSTTTTDTNAVSNRVTDVDVQTNLKKGSMGCESISFATNQMLSATQKTSCSISSNQLSVQQTANLNNVSDIVIGSGCQVNGDVNVKQRIASTLKLSTNVSQETVSQTTNALKETFNNILDKSTKIHEENKGAVSGDQGSKEFAANVEKAKKEIDERTESLVSQNLQSTLNAANESNLVCGEIDKTTYNETAMTMKKNQIEPLEDQLDMLKIELNKMFPNYDYVKGETTKINKEIANIGNQMYIVSKLDNINIDQEIIAKMISKTVVTNVVKTISNLDSVKKVMNETRETIEKDYKYKYDEKLADAIKANADLSEASLPPPIDLDAAGIIEAAGAAHSNALTALGGLMSGGSGAGGGGFTGSFGGIIKILFVILLLVGIGLGVWYYMTKKKKVPDVATVASDVATAASDVVQKFGRRMRKFGKNAKKFF